MEAGGKGKLGRLRSIRDEVEVVDDTNEYRVSERVISGNCKIMGGKEGRGYAR